MQAYLQRLGPDASLNTLAAFTAATKAEDPFAKGGVLDWMNDVPSFAACRADPLSPPDLSDFLAAREDYLDIFTAVMAEHRLDALVFPQMRDTLPPLHGPETIHETTVCEINIAGLPGVVMPAGTFASGAPFCLIFVGASGARPTCWRWPTITSRRRSTGRPRPCRPDQEPADPIHPHPEVREAASKETSRDRGAFGASFEASAALRRLR